MQVSPGPASDDGPMPSIPTAVVDENPEAPVDVVHTVAADGADNMDTDAPERNVAPTAWINNSRPSTQKRKAGQGPQDIIKARVMEIAETEHKETMQYLDLKKKNAQLICDKKLELIAIKHEVALLKKEKLQRELYNSPQSIFAANVSSLRRSNDTDITTCASPTTATCTITSSQCNTSQLWHPFD